MKKLTGENGQAKTWLTLGIIVLLIILFALFSKQEASDDQGMVGDDGAKTEEVLKIGFMGPLSGDVAAFGTSFKKAVDLAHSQHGAEKVEIIYEDTQCDPQQSVNAANKLIFQDGVVAIMGELCSGATVAAAAVAEANQIVLISPASTSPTVSEAGDFVFRTVPSDALQGAFGAELVQERGFEKLAILYSNEEYGLGFNNVLNDRFIELGGQVVQQEAFERGATDMRAQLTKIKAARPDALYIVSNSLDSSAAAIRQAGELGLGVQLFGSEGLKSDDILAVAGKAGEGMIVTSVSSGSAEFAGAHEAEYGEAPGPFAAQGYDAYAALIQTIEDGATDGPGIRDALYDLSFDGASGMIEFDDNGDIAGNYEVYSALNGTFVRIDDAGDAMEKEDESDEEEA